MFESTNFFNLLNLPNHFELNQVQLEKKYLAAVKQNHPDKHQGNLSKTEQTSLINQAYQVLSHPIKRAKHLARLMGLQDSENNNSMSADFLLEQMQLNEKLESLKDSSSSELKNFHKQLQEKMKHNYHILNECFKAKDLNKIGEQINICKFYQQLLDKSEN